MSNNGEYVIRANGHYLKTLIGMLRDVQKKTQRGFGFNKNSSLYIEAPADNTLLFSGTPSKGKGSSYVSVVAQGLNVTEGDYPAFDPSRIWKWVKVGGKDREIALQLREDLLKVAYGGISNPGFRGGMPSADNFDVEQFVEKKDGKISRTMDLNFETLKIDVSISSLRGNLELMENLEEDYFAFYFVDGDLYTHVSSGGSGEVTRPVSLSDAFIRKGEERLSEENLFDFSVPVSNDIVWTLIRNSDYLEISIPREWRKLPVIQWGFMNKLSESEIIQGNVISGRNKQFKDMYKLDEFRQKLRRNEF